MPKKNSCLATQLVKIQHGNCSKHWKINLKKNEYQQFPSWLWFEKKKGGGGHVEKKTVWIPNDGKQEKENRNDRWSTGTFKNNKLRKSKYFIIKNF